MVLPKFSKFATQAIHQGQEPEQWNSRGVVPPIAMATTFQQDGPGEHRGFEYSRSGNPTRLCFEKCLAALDDAKFGLAFASGLAAENTIMLMLKSGDHVVCMDDLYGGSNRLFDKVLRHHGLAFDFVDCTDLEIVKKSIKPENTKIVWIESPTNPTLKLVDIAAVSKIAHDINPDIIVVVDNTFMSPYFQRPLSLGADISFNSVTKYINGHTDTILGGMTTNNEAIYTKMKYLQNAAGGVPSPFDCYLANRGAKTLHLRMERHEQNAMEVAKFLSEDKRVAAVIYPGLESHPQHELAKRQCTGFGGMLSFRIKGDLETARCFLKSLKLFILAESLGGYECLVEHPALMTHAAVDKEVRDKLGISDTLIRMSIGLEDIADIKKDISDALEVASKTTHS